ncbi:MAG TPA: thioredoxin [Planctomycetes bacterium]|nr:thioredoxin [Planctomycetota bacterium]HIN79516.1 thioredoxin [Planctomycetota bacterium]
MAGNLLHIDDNNFETEIVSGGAPAMLDFYATWCGPCKTIAPIVEELADSYSEKGVKVGKVDIDVAKNLAVKFKIQGVPTLLFFKDGEVVETVVGAQPRNVIESKIESLL